MSSAATREAVKVAVRVRPFSKTESDKGYENVVAVDQTNNSIFISKPKSDDKMQFSYDYVFPSNCTQEEIYERTAVPIVMGVLDGFNGTIFAYGQTGTGKTYTMDGSREGKDRGIVPRAFEHIFEYMTANQESHKFSVTITYVEIYNEKIRDLLAQEEEPEPLVIHEDEKHTFYMKGVTTKTVQTIDELAAYQIRGSERRRTRKTGMNNTSSRSHSILTLSIETLTEIDGGSHVRQGRLNLVDLAGSERVEKTGMEGQGLKEGISINYALMILGNCISALTTPGSKHIPYRDSALTKLLRDSLGGNARTLMIATLGPADYNYNESMSTLRYAERAKKIENKPKVNMDPKDALLMKYQEELQELQKRVQGGGAVLDPEEAIRAMEKKLEHEKRQYEQDSNMAAEEKAKLKQKLEHRKKKLEQEKKKQQLFKARIGEIEKYLVGGGQELEKRTRENEAQIAACREKLRQREERAAALQREVEEKARAKQQMLEQCNTAQAKLKLIQEKFSEAVHRYKDLKAKKPEIQKTIQFEREALLETADKISRKIDLYQQIVDNFVPPSEKERLESRLEWDKENGQWNLMKKVPKEKLIDLIQKFQKPKSAAGFPRPTAMDSRHKLGMQIGSVDDLPQLQLMATPVDSKLKQGPKIYDTAAIDAEIEEAFKDDEPDLVVEIPMELPGIGSTTSNMANLVLRRQ